MVFCYKLTFGSFETLGILKAARTECLAGVVAKPLGDALARTLVVEELQAALGRAARERRLTLREAMLKELESGAGTYGLCRLWYAENFLLFSRLSSGLEVRLLLWCCSSS